MNPSLPTISHLKDPKAAYQVLNKALKRFANDNNSDEFLFVLRQLTKIHGGMSRLSKKIGVNRQNLYRTFTHDGNPKLKSLATILKGLGYRMTIEPIYKPESKHKEEQHEQQ